MKKLKIPITLVIFAGFVQLAFTQSTIITTLVPPYPGDATKFLNGIGQWSAAGGGGPSGQAYWITNGSGALVPSGVVQSNLFSITPSGKLWLGQYSADYNQTDLSLTKVLSHGEGPELSSNWRIFGDDTAIWGAFIDHYNIISDETSGSAETVWKFTGTNGTSFLRVHADPQGMRITATDVNGYGFYLDPLGIDSANRFEFQTAPMESGTLFRLGNSTTNVLTVDWAGAASLRGVNAGLSAFDTDTHLGLDVVAGGGNPYISIYSDDFNFAVLDPSGTGWGSGYRYLFNTEGTLASGIHTAFQNSNTNIATLQYDGRITLQSRTNLIGDNGTTLTYNGEPIAASGGTVTNLTIITNVNNTTITTNLTVINNTTHGGKVTINTNVYITQGIQIAQGTITQVGTNTIDFDGVNSFNSMTATGNINLAWSNLATNRMIQLLIKQPLSSNVTLSLPSGTHGYYTGTLSNGWHLLSATAWGSVNSNVWVSVSSDGTY